MRLRKLSMTFCLCYSSFIQPIKPTSHYSSTMFLPLAHIISEMVVLVLAASVEARLWFTHEHSSGQIGVPTNRLAPFPFWLIDSLHFLPTAEGYTRYEFNQLVYSLIFMLILTSILYSNLATPNRFFFPSKSLRGSLRLISDLLSFFFK